MYCQHENSYFKIRQKTYGKKVTTKKLYNGTISYWDFDSDNVITSGKLRYCFSKNQKKKQISITVYNEKMKSKGTSVFNIENWIDNEVINGKTYNLRCNELKILGENKVQILYSVLKTNRKTFYGGVAVLDMKKQSVISNKRLSFSPYKSDDTYIYGSDFREEKPSKLYIARKKTGKVLKTYLTDYGLDQNAQYLICESSLCEMDDYKSLHQYDFCEGQVIIVNYSGIYVGSVETDGLEKIADLLDLAYYTDNYKEKMIYKIALKSKSEFSIAYADEWETPDLVIKKYKAK